MSVKSEDACEGPSPTAGLPIVNDQENCLTGEPLLEDSLPLAVLENSHQAYGNLDLKANIANDPDQQQLPTHVSGGLQHTSEQQIPVVQTQAADVTSHQQGALFHTSFGLEGAAAHTGAGSFPHSMHTLPHHGMFSHPSFRLSCHCSCNLSVSTPKNSRMFCLICLRCKTFHQLFRSHCVYPYPYFGEFSHLKHSRL